MQPNPFKPTAGATPPLLIGRKPALDALSDALDEGPGSPGRLTIFTGARGVGKTVMLNEVEEIASTKGWYTINETATPGLVGRLEEHLAHLSHTRHPRPRRRVTSVTLPMNLGGVESDLTPEAVVSLRRRITDLLDELGRDHSGLLVTIDEVHAGVRSEMREIATLTQHLIREDREFALVMAGLPSAVSSLLSDDVLTFLRRADKQVLSDVPIEEVQDALVTTITDHGRTIDETASRVAAEATGGYPFLVQLIGYHVWRSSKAVKLDGRAVERGIAAARQRLGSLVHETALSDLSDVDRTFLMAMSIDDGPSKMGDILERMGGLRPQNGNTYRLRLLQAGMIEQVSRGKVDFSLPYLRDFLREHGASLGLAPTSRRD